MDKIKLYETNVINIEDTNCYNSIFDITVVISNAINPVFRIYANSVDMALEILVDKLVDLDNINILAFEIEDYDKIEDSYYNIDDRYWIDLNYLNIKEVY